MTERSDKKAAERGKKWERRSDERPAELMTAALRLFAERGFAGTRLEDVAASAGVSKATVYLYFDNKESLFEAVVRDTVTPRLEQADALLDAFDGSTPNLVRTMLALLEGVLDGPLPSVLKVVIAESGNFPELARLWGDVVLRRLFKLLHRVVQRGIDRGEFRSVNPSDIVPLIGAPVVILGLWKQSFGVHTEIHLDPRAVMAAHVDMLLRGLSKPAPGRAREKGKR
ncbi:MAG: TetR/AcrR family transcriptional regulator [Polyangiaceae bacterium]|jgi:AcrR family transcriptional regulator